MSYTILSAQYANEDNSAAVIMTRERFAVAISAVDTPAEWQALQDWAKSNVIAPLPAPSPPATASQRVTQMLQAYKLTLQDLKTELAK